MKKLIIAATLALTTGAVHAEMTVEQAQSKKVELTAEMLQNMESNGPELGITPKGMRNLHGTLAAFQGQTHNMITDALTQGRTCDQIKAGLSQIFKEADKEHPGTPGAAAFWLSLGEWSSADCIETRARLEAAK